LFAPTPVGLIEGVTSTESFTIAISSDGIGKNDYLEVTHEGSSFLLMVKEVRRAADKSLGSCVIVGRQPKTPFIPGAAVYAASEATLRKGLGMETREAEGLFVGKLKGTPLKVWLPIKKLTRLFVVGKPGAGKSYTMGVVAEELLKKGVPLVIIDAHGEYSSLKVPADVKEGTQVSPSSFSEQIIEFGEMAFNPGADIDVSALDSTRAEDLVCQMQCTIINLRGLTLEQQHSIVSKALKRLLEAAMLMKIPPFYLALDEAHLFAGRSKTNETDVRETLEIVKRFAQEGRKFGANMIVLTQRPQLLDMTVRSLSATWIIHQLTDPNDIRIATESGGLGKEWEGDINWLEAGDAVVTGDVVERIPLLLRIRARETRHGAPGFNPLDFVSPEERERMMKRMAALKERLLTIKVAPGEPQPLPPTLPSLYLPVKVDEAAILAILKEKRSLDGVELLKSELRYRPALFAEVTVNSERSTPDIIFNERVRRLIPADASVASLDWRHESAYRMMAGEVLELPLSPTPSRAGRHEVPTSTLLDASGVEGLKGTLRNYVVSKLTQPIYHSKGLDDYSRPGESLDDFKARLRVKLEERTKARAAEVRSKFAASVGAIRERTKAEKDELNSKEKLLGEIKIELKSLEREKVAAQKEGRSTLKLSSQIQLREERMARLERGISEFDEGIAKAKKEEEQLEAEMRREVSRMEREAAALMEGPVESMVFQPRAEEIELHAMQLLWVPVIDALFRGIFGKTSTDFRTEWNAVNGRGDYGSCSECGSSISSLDGELFCFVCGKMLCDGHMNACTVCRRSVCKDHGRKCSGCGKVVCSEEEPLKCAACGALLCPGCARHCNDCIEKVYCRRHISECSVCKKKYCPEHLGLHVKYCQHCGKGLCVQEQVICKDCGKAFCKADSNKCSACGCDICEEHTSRCPDCGRGYCKDETFHVCKQCGAKVCNECVNFCAVCGGPTCRAHTVVCPNCSEKVCGGCMVETKRLGIFKRVLCKTCASR
jgi:hypothetical protein